MASGPESGPRRQRQRLPINSGVPKRADAMNPPARKFPWTIAIGLLLLVLTASLALLLAEVNSRLVHRIALPMLGLVADFSLTNQTGAAVSLANLRGHP